MITLKEYFEAVKSTKWFVGIPIVLPAFSQLLSQRDTTAYLVPPLGDDQGVFLIVTSLALAAFSWIVFEVRRSRKKRRPFLSFSLLVVSLFAFVALNIFFVKHIYYDRLHQEDSVSVGYARTAFTPEKLVGKVYSDLDLLRLTGTDERVIEKLWTPRSIHVVRLLLWLSYTMFLGTLIWLISSMAYQHAVDEASHPSN